MAEGFFMQWIVAAAGLLILLLLALAVRPRRKPGYRYESLADSLGEHLRLTAARMECRGYARLSMRRGMNGALERAVGYLNTLPEAELLPSGRWLCDNGRFLQEEIASMRLALQQAPRLRRVRGGPPRIRLLARELVGHSAAHVDAQRLREAVAAWQEAAPLDTRELDALPLALQLTLTEIITDLAIRCALEQRARMNAVKVASLMRRGREKQFLRLFARYEKDPAFLERLVSELRAQDDVTCAAWLDRYFGSHDLSAGKLAQSEHEHQTESCLWLSNAIVSLRSVDRMPWHRLCEELSLIHAQLCADAVYPRMDRESRAYYRMRLSRLSVSAKRPEQTVCAAALALAAAGADEARKHVGYYLLDRGRRALLRSLRAYGLKSRLRLWVEEHASVLMRLTGWTAFAAIAAALSQTGWTPALWLALSAVLAHAVRNLALAACRRLVPPRMTPRMRVPSLQEETRTLVVCPTMLLDSAHALAMVKHLSVLRQANRDPRLDFMLLGDFRDSLTANETGDADIVRTAAAATQALCEDTGHAFYYMQRERVFSPRDQTHMSRERKRGSLETLFRLICDRPVEERFAYCSLPPESLRGRYRYVIALDSDTLLPPGSALRLVGAMLHPLNRRRVEQGRMRGVSIVQPRMEIAAHTVKSWLSLWLGGSGGSEPYNALVADFYQDACGRGTFMGKGIIDPEAFLQATEGRILPGTVLSHDLLEGELAGCALASDITLYDGHPRDLRGFMFRLHRWTRGDWQLLPYVLLPWRKEATRGALDAHARHRVRHNMLRSLIAPLRVAVMLLAVGLGQPWALLAALVVPELPYLLRPDGRALAGCLCRLAVLPVEAGVQADAAVRALYRLFVSHRRLLQWTTAAQTMRERARPPMSLFYLSMGAAAAVAAVGWLPGGCAACGLTLAAWWALMPFALPLMERPYQKTQRPTEFMRETLLHLAQETWRFFDTAITPRDHDLPPDNVQIEPNKGVTHRTSPTNIGLYLTSLLAAERLRILSPQETAERMERTVATLESLPKWKGHLNNWYDTTTLQPLSPPFVSTVDSGNLAVCLLTCAQGVRVLMPELAARFSSLAARLDALTSEMDFAALYDADAGLFYVGMHTDRSQPTAEHYDLLASEARMTSFAAILMGQVPLRHWYRLGRMFARTPGGKALVSYSGTMFEYMMPLLFQPPVRGTLLYNACAEAFRLQRRHRVGGVFGVSESGYYAFDPNLLYQYRAFGLPSLALAPDNQSDVVAPYATLLAAPMGARKAFANVLRLRNLGMEGPLGLFEAADFCRARTGKPMRIVRSHMAHHQGMILLAVCNLLEEDYIATLFSSLPRVEAYRLLLEEKPLRARGLVRRPFKQARRETPVVPLHAAYHAQPLRFPVEAHVLGGAGTTLFADARGGGYLQRDGVMLTRFHESCHLPSGPRFYLRDSRSGANWCVTDPAFVREVTFETGQVRYVHERFGVEGTLRAYVNPLDGAVIHLLTLRNLSGAAREMEVCSYLEPALASREDDAAHPAFQNLFIRTAKLNPNGVEAVRRSRGDEPERRLWHRLCADVPFQAFCVQTDRTSFLGRNRGVESPRELDLPMEAVAGEVGDVIEPCLSLRARFSLPNGAQARLAFVTALPNDNDTPEAFGDRYAQPEAAARCYESALTRGLVTARYLSLSAEAQTLVWRLAGCLGYTGQPWQFRYALDNALPLRGLWALGISGDYPILLVECHTEQELDLARLALKAHAYFRLNGLRMDLALVCAQPSGYVRPLRDALSNLAGVSHSHDLIGKPGGVHLFDPSGVTPEQLALLRAAARLVLQAGQGGLKEQLAKLDTALLQGGLATGHASWKAELPPLEALEFGNGYGGFTPGEGDYVIDLPPGRETPAPWCNPLCSERFGTLAGESGLVFSYAANSQAGRLTRWVNDSVLPQGEENVFVRDDENGLLWSLTRLPLGLNLPVRVRHAPGCTEYETSGYGLYARMQCFTDGGIGARAIHLKNEGTDARTLTLMHAAVFTIGDRPNAWQLCSLSREEGGVLVAHPHLDGPACLCALDGEPQRTATMSVGAYSGLWGSAPAALRGALPCDAGNVGVLCYRLTLAPGETRTIVSALCHAPSRACLRDEKQRFCAQGASRRLYEVRALWEGRLDGLRFDLPDRALQLMLGRWLPYQVRASRLWMRAGFYQAGGAVGFRDRLQDLLCLMPTEPDVVRAMLLDAAAHQFEEGDVQHWWHPPRYGVRTRCSDDLLFLPFVCAQYVTVTGDETLLEESVPYLREPPLAQGEASRLTEPQVSDVSESVRLHCLRAIAHVGLGAHGLPLMGGGDWNDGMDRVGGENGESVWLGMFLCEVLRRFAPLCGEADRARLEADRRSLMAGLDRYAWDGGWYLRAWYDDGTRLGGSGSEECRIDLLPQAWGVICGVNRDRCASAMDQAWRLLYDRSAGLMRLFAPPFDGVEQPGYIAGYLPGVRENGGHYAHAAAWAVSALYQLGMDTRAWELARAMLPINRSLNRRQAALYRTEPYAMAADIYANPQQRGRGGWTWYTGSASWYQHVLLTELLGFQKEGTTLRFRPVVPPGWDELRLTYRFGSATYHLRACRDCAAAMADGERLADGRLTLADDGRIHEAVFPLRQ